MTRVDDHFVGSLNGHLAAALAVAHSKNGGVYPVGTVIQLLPQEAMVKRYKGYSPGTDDWEMFSLKVSAQGTKIVTEGKTNVVNQFGRTARRATPQPFALRLRVRQDARLRAAPAPTRSSRPYREAIPGPELGDHLTGPA